ncbi:AraC family transcriptional regulator [uncultured Psychroserpens sp.]|uniref:helix-turn-helix domain-containing protein n=1 Tax=uncultured Psychroserpens sp. TaxID=255436 RepID=UPI00260B8630|nr:helix-turn-helix domain-containing protein [uncultured Psychroserpens sp.]
MENKLEIIGTIGKIAVFIMLLLSVFLFTVTTKNKLSNRLFGIYLLVIAFDLIGLFTNKISEFPDLQILKTSSSLLQLPLFYLYVLSACYSNFKIIKKHFYHFVLFIIFLVIFKITNLSEQVSILYEIVGEVQYLVYIIAVFVVLKKYKTVYLENYSNANYAIYKWLFQITVFSCIAHSFVFIRWYLSSSGYKEYILNINLLISLSVLAIIIFFVLKALYQPELFTGINMNLKPMKLILEKDNTAIIQKDTSDNQNLKKLTSIMEEEKPYLNFELTLQKLAIQTDIPERDLSLLINHDLNKHFFDFINEYRINDAKALLNDPTKKELTVLEILYEVGFNSKSSFYTAFKKVTNQTPSAYRKSIS